MTVFGVVRAGCQGLGVARMFADDSPVQRIVSGWVRLDPWSNLDQSMGGVVEFANGLKLYCHNDRVAKRGLEVIGALARAIQLGSVIQLATSAGIMIFFRMVAAKSVRSALV